MEMLSAVKMHKRWNIQMGAINANTGEDIKSQWCN